PTVVVVTFFGAAACFFARAATVDDGDATVVDDGASLCTRSAFACEPPLHAATSRTSAPSSASLVRERVTAAIMTDQTGPSKRKSDELLVAAQHRDRLRRTSLRREHDLLVGLGRGIEHHRDPVVVEVEHTRCPEPAVPRP